MESTRPAGGQHERAGRETSGADVLIGAARLAAAVAQEAGRRSRPVVGPLARVALDPPMVPRRLRPQRWLASLAMQGTAQRDASRAWLLGFLDAAVPAAVEQLVQRVDLTGLVLRYVDLDGIVAEVDLDAAAKRLDVNAVVDEVDLEGAVRRVDLDAVVKRVDLDAVVARVDLDRAAGRIDVDAVARRLDLDAVLDRIDLTAVVLQRVDLDALVRAVLDRIDLPALAEEVIDAVDLPEIIRESTGSMASDTVRGARMQGIAADEAVGRVRDRLLLRRRPTPGQVAGPPASDAAPTIPSQPVRRP